MSAKVAARRVNRLLNTNEDELDQLRPAKSEQDFLDADDMIARLRVKKTYTFGKYRDAEVTVFYGTPLAIVETFAIGGESTRRVCRNYSEAAGYATLHKMMMYDKYHR